MASYSWALFIPTGVLFLILPAILKGQEECRGDNGPEESELERARRERREEDERLESQAREG